MTLAQVDDQLPTSNPDSAPYWDTQSIHKLLSSEGAVDNLRATERLLEKTEWLPRPVKSVDVTDEPDHCIHPGYDDHHPDSGGAGQFAGPRQAPLLREPSGRDSGASGTAGHDQRESARESDSEGSHRGQQEVSERDQGL